MAASGRIPNDEYRNPKRKKCPEEIENQKSIIENIDGGEGGIRTLGTLLGYGALAKLCFQPLSHLTKAAHRAEAEYCS
jgi:hypothetical protein